MCPLTSSTKLVHCTFIVVIILCLDLCASSKFSANLLLFFDMCKFCTPVLSTFYIFYLFFRILRPLARNCIPVISSIVRLYHRLSLSSFPRDLIPRFLYVHSPAFNAGYIVHCPAYYAGFFLRFTGEFNSPLHKKTSGHSLSTHLLPSSFHH